MLPRALAAAILTLVTACTTATSESDTLALTDALAGVANDSNAAIADLFAVLDQVYDDRSQLYQRLVDLRLPTRIAIALDKAQRVEPPPGAEAELERYLDYLGDLLLATEALDLAIATEDPASTAIAAVSIEVTAGALAVSLPGATCPTLAPATTRDLCEIGGLDGYEHALSFEMRRFVASFRPALRISDTFGDVIRGRVLGTLQGDAALVLADAAARIGALDPGEAYGRLSQILVDYFPAAAAAWAEYGADPTGSDPRFYPTIVDALEGERIATQRLLAAEPVVIASADPSSAISEVTGVWFGAEPTR